MPSPEDSADSQRRPVSRGSGGGAPGGRSRSEPAVIALQMEDLALWVTERVVTFPRIHKFGSSEESGGDRLVETCLDITVGLIDASYLPHRSRDKLARLCRASRDLTRARVRASVS